MALDTAFYLVTRDIAIRSGVVDRRYRTMDGRYILDNKDLSRVRFTTDEYISGLKGVEKITEQEAQKLIASNGFKKGLGIENASKELGEDENEETVPVADNEPTIDNNVSEVPQTGEESDNKATEEEIETNKEEKEE